MLGRGLALKGPGRGWKSVCWEGYDGRGRAVGVCGYIGVLLTFCFPRGFVRM
jgi:hypothetical protein